MSNTVSVFRFEATAPYLSHVTTLPVGRAPSGIAVTPRGSFVNGDYVYVANHEDGTLSVIDATRDAVVAVIPVGAGALGVAVGIVPSSR